jgi:hypothetical protein
VSALPAPVDLVACQLTRCGLRRRRLDSRQIAELLHRCCSPRAGTGAAVARRARRLYDAGRQFSQARAPEDPPGRIGSQHRTEIRAPDTGECINRDVIACVTQICEHDSWLASAGGRFPRKVHPLRRTTSPNRPPTRSRLASANWSHHEQATIDDDRLPVDVAGRRPREERHRVANVVGRADAWCNAS